MFSISHMNTEKAPKAPNPQWAWSTNSPHSLSILMVNLASQGPDKDKTIYENV